MVRLRTVANRWLSSVLAVLGTALVVLVVLALFGEHDSSGSGAEVVSAGPSPSGGRVTASATPSVPSPSPGLAPVLVLNQATVPRLADATANVIAARGWKIVATGNFTGTVPANTVYYPPGLEPAARALVAQFPQITQRVRPAFTGLRPGRITLILSKDWR